MIQLIFHGYMVSPFTAMVIVGNQDIDSFRVNENLKDTFLRNSLYESVSYSTTFNICVRNEALCTGFNSF